MLFKLLLISFLLFSFKVYGIPELNNDDACLCSQNTIDILCNETTLINWNGTYCDNFKCTYNLSPPANCPTTHYKLTIFAALRPSIDYLIFKNNGNIIQKFISGSKTITNFFYSAANNYTIEFQSGASAIPPKPTDDFFWAVTVNPMTSPNFNSVNLNNINSRHAVWLPDMIKNDALIVCNNVSTKTTLKMFSTYTRFGDLLNFAIYDSQNLDNFIQNLEDAENLPSLPNVRSKESASKCFTIYASEDFNPIRSGNTVLFMAVDNENDKNCQEKDIVFQMVADGSQDFNVSLESADKVSCEMILLATTSAGTELPHIWIRDFPAASNDGVFNFKSILNNNTLLDLRGSQISLWKYLGFYTSALSIVASQSSKLLIHFSADDQSLKWINDDFKDVQKGIITSPSYCGFMGTFKNSQLYHTLNFYQKKLINFDIIQLYGTPDIVLNIDEKPQKLNSYMSTTMTSNFSINYAETDPIKNGFLIQYTLTNFSVEKTTTPNHSSAFNIQISHFLTIIYVLTMFF